jgi:renierapurpurin 18,18'-hydroxylase
MRLQTASASAAHDPANVTRLDPSGEPRDLRRTGIHPDHWYPLARSKDVVRGKTLPVSFAGTPIVLVRGEDGVAFALENRCAHRQVPLHLGVVQGERLQCTYHCWTYDRTGRCVNVPYLDRERTLPTGVRSFPCREAYGLVFVYPGDPARLEAAAFPEIPAAADPAYKTRYLDRRVECHYSFMHENLMDMNHQFLHRRWMGRIRTIFLGIREAEDALDVDYTFQRTGGRQPLGERFIITRRSDGGEGAKAKDHMTIRTEYPYQTLRFWTAGTAAPALSIWNVYVPVDREQRTNHTFGLLMVRRPKVPGLIHLLWPAIVWFTENIFREDKRIVEEEQRAFDAQGSDWNQEIFPIILALRRLLVERGVPVAT